MKMKLDIVFSFLFENGNPKLGLLFSFCFEYSENCGNSEKTRRSACGPGDPANICSIDPQIFCLFYVSANKCLFFPGIVRKLELFIFLLTNASAFDIL